MQTVEEKFHAALDYVKSLPEKFQTPGEIDTRLYALKQQATVGPCNKENAGVQPYQIQFGDRAKWDAWAALGDMSKTAAMVEYVQLLGHQSDEWAAPKTANLTGEKPHDWMDTVKEKAVDVKDYIQEKAHVVVEEVKYLAHEAKEKVLDLAEGTNALAHDAKDKVQEKSHDWMESAKENSHNLMEATKEKAAVVGSYIQDKSSTLVQNVANLGRDTDEASVLLSDGAGMLPLDHSTVAGTVTGNTDTFTGANAPATTTAVGEFAQRAKTDDSSRAAVDYESHLPDKSTFQQMLEKVRDKPEGLSSQYPASQQTSTHTNDLYKENRPTNSYTATTRTSPVVRSVLNPISPRGQPGHAVSPTARLTRSPLSQPISPQHIDLTGKNPFAQTGHFQIGQQYPISQPTHSPVGQTGEFPSGHGGQYQPGQTTSKTIQQTPPFDHTATYRN